VHNPRISKRISCEGELLYLCDRLNEVQDVVAALKESVEEGEQRLTLGVCMCVCDGCTWLGSVCPPGSVCGSLG